MNIQLTNEQFQIYLENQNKQTLANTNNSNTQQRDPEKTGVHMFNKDRENIYEYLSIFDTIAANRYNGDPTKLLQALLTRFHPNDIMKLGKNVNGLTYQDIRDKMYSKLGAHLAEKDMSLTGMLMQKEEHITDFLTRLQHRWIGYNNWLVTERRHQKTENEFIELFIDTLPSQYRQVLALLKVNGQIKTIDELQTIIDRYKYVWKTTSESNTNNTEIQKLQEQLKSTEQTIHKILIPQLNNMEQKFTKTIESTLQT